MRLIQSFLSETFAFEDLKKKKKLQFKQNIFLKTLKHVHTHMEIS